MSAILKFDFQKKRTITFFWSKLSKLHKKDPILHVATTFSLKQWETRTSHGPIPNLLIKVEIQTSDNSMQKMQSTHIFNQNRQNMATRVTSL